MKICLISLVSLLCVGQLSAANPTSKATWSAYSATIDGVSTPADSYEVAIITQTQNMNSAGTTPTASDTVTVTQALLKDLMAGLANGPYRLQVRAKIGTYYTAWSTPVDFTWSGLLPNLVSNVVINPL